METLQDFGMVEDRLRQWAGAALKSEVSFNLPDKTQAAGKQVNFYLFDLLNTPRPRAGAKRPPSQITLRYLATAASPEQDAARRLSSDLLFEAMENRDLEVEPDSVPLQMWLALGLPPQPAFIFRIGLIRLREEKEAPVVKKFVVQSGTIMGMNGQVIGPGETPIMNAVVEMPTLKTSAQTDSNGRFSFATVPAEPPEIDLVIKARGKEMSVRTTAHHRPENLVIIQFNVLEE